MSVRPGLRRFHAATQIKEKLHGAVAGIALKALEILIPIIRCLVVSRAIDDMSNAWAGNPGGDKTGIATECLGFHIDDPLPSFWQLGVGRRLAVPIGYQLWPRPWLRRFCRVWSGAFSGRAVYAR
jgi:hypothetical protein